MANEVRQGKTVAGKTNYTVTIGKTTYVRTQWKDIIDILSMRKNDIPSVNAGYKQGVFSGD